MIIDAHSHLNTDEFSFVYCGNLNANSFISSMQIASIDKSLVSLNPKIMSFSCPSDCIFHCPLTNGINRNIQNCSMNCKFKNRHIVSTIDSKKVGYVSLYCNTCKKVIYEEIDPLRLYNLELLKIAKQHPKQIYPLLSLSVANSSINEEISFYESNFSFCGYKIHTQACHKNVNCLEKLKTNKPILIHSGISQYDNPNSIIEFSKKYEGPVIIAHAARLSIKSLIELSRLENVYVDACPSEMLFNNKSFALYPELATKVNSPQDIYKLLLDYLSPKKILFGSDYPWGNRKNELDIFSSLGLSHEDSNDILFKNALEIFNI